MTLSHPGVQLEQYPWEMQIQDNMQLLLATVLVT